jgi:uncharacterized protein YndB with AHSA1/START domain
VTAEPGEAPAAEATAYARQLTIHAGPGRVFNAIATLDGLRCWWTTIVTGSAAPGGTLRFGFAGLDEQIVMHAAEIKPPPHHVVLRGTPRDDEWTGSAVRSG